MDSIMRATEPLTTKEFFALDVDERLKVELIGGALVTHTADPLTADDFFAFGLDKKLKAELIGGALVVRASSKPWHGRVANRLARHLEDVLGDQFAVFTDLGVIVDEENVPQPDVFVIRRSHDPDRVTEASDVLLAVEIMSSGSRVYDRLVKPSLYRDAGIPSWRIERSGRHLALFDIPLRGDYQTQLGQVTLKVAGIDVPIDLEAIVAYALGV